MQLTGAEIVIECLKEQGVDTVFGYPAQSFERTKNNEATKPCSLTAYARVRECKCSNLTNRRYPGS